MAIIATVLIICFYCFFLFVQNVECTGINKQTCSRSIHAACALETKCLQAIRATCSH